MRTVGSGRRIAGAANRPGRTREAVVRQPPPDLLEQIDAARVERGQIALWHTGGAGYVIRTSEATLYLDPCGRLTREKGAW